MFVEIYEEDGKGNFSLVSTDKDCLKLMRTVVAAHQSSVELGNLKANIQILTLLTFGHIHCLTNELTCDSHILLTSSGIAH